MLKIARQVLIFAAIILFAFLVFKKDWSSQKSEITIYGTLTCPYCIKAKNVCSQAGVSYRFINVKTSSGEDMDLFERLPEDKKRTVPQIFINNEHVGGYSDLLRLNVAIPLKERVSK